MTALAVWLTCALAANAADTYDFTYADLQYVITSSNTIDDVSWNDNSSVDTTQPVGQKTPNELGLFDMSGNVWEWCYDYYDTYSSDAQTNPMGPTSGSERVARGGAFFNGESGQRVWFRNHTLPTNAADGLGFRLAL